MFVADLRNTSLCLYKVCLCVSYNNQVPKSVSIGAVLVFLGFWVCTRCTDEGYRALVGKPEGRNHLKDPGVDGRIILKWILERLVGGELRTDRSGLG
jgi:hypothetical protein